MADLLASWERKYYADCNSDAFLFYVAFGEITQDKRFDSLKYRSAGIPSGFDLMAYDKTRHAEVIKGFLQEYPWEQLNIENPGLARKIEQSPGCIILRGTVENPKTLNYFRDCIGLLTYFLDNGACSIFDPQMFHWWSPEQWRERVFDPSGPVPLHHVVVLYSEDEQSPELLWIHTRGMRKFGRPDISIQHVGPAYRDAVIDLCQRFIVYQASGGIIPEGQEVRMASLPPGGVAHHGGDIDDPDFNNAHVEFVWPEPGLALHSS